MNKIVLHFVGVELSLQTLVCILHLQHISIQTHCVQELTSHVRLWSQVRW